MNIKNRLEKLEDERKTSVEGYCPHLPTRFVPYGTADDGGQQCSKCGKPQFGYQFVPYYGDGKSEE